MIHRFASAAVASVMLLHAVFGCCWHHSHGDCAPDCHAAVVSGAHGHGCAGHRHGERLHAPHPPFGEEPADEDHGDCDGDVCRFLSAAAVERPAGSVGAVFVTAQDAPSTVVVALAALSLARADGGAADSRSAARLRPLLCVWRV